MKGIEEEMRKAAQALGGNVDVILSGFDKMVNEGLGKLSKEEKKKAEDFMNEQDINGKLEELQKVKDDLMLKVRRANN